MGLFSKLKHAFHNIGHAIEHVAKDVAHGIEHVAKDIGNAAHEAANAVNDIAHGRLRAALNDMASVGTNLAKGLTDVEKTAVDAAADATVDLHLSKAMDKMAASAKQMAAKMADNTVKAVDHIGHSLANDTATMASDVGHLTKDVVTGHFDAAKHDLSKYGTDWGHTIGNLGKDAAEVVKTVAANAGEVGKCATDSAAAALQDMHISKSVDRFAEKASHTIDKGIDTTVKITKQVADGVADDVAGTVDGAVAMTKDLVNGQGGKLLHDGLNTAMSAVSAACDLTPEGLAANAVMATMKTAHIGNEMVQNIVGGLVGGPKGLMKRVAETGLGVGAGEVLNKVTSGHTETALLMAGTLAPAAAGMLGGRRGGHVETPHQAPSGAGPHHPDAGGPAPDGAHGPEAKPETKPEKPAPASNWHEVLGVGPDATRGQINQAYRKLSLQHHPDKGGDVEKQKEINNARDAALADLEKNPRTAKAPEAKPEAKPETKSGTQPEAKPEAKPESKPQSKTETKSAAEPEAKQPEAKPAAQPETKGRDVKPDQASPQSDLSSSTQLSLSSHNQADLHTTTALQVSPASPASPTSTPVPHEEEAAKPKDNNLADSAGNVAGAAGAVAGTASTLAGSAETAAAIAAAQASAAIAMAAQVAMAAIQNAIALNEAQCHVSEEIGKGVKSLSQ